MRHQAVVLIGVSQIVCYGALYYSYSIVAGDIARTFSWPVSWVFGAFSVALLAGGFVSPIVGRQIDRYGAPPLMALGTLASSVALAVAALAPNPAVFIVALILSQLASTYAQYDAAFACIVQLNPAQARIRITHLTLIAGFSSTLFWPLTTWLLEFWSWRTVLFSFAVLNLAVCLPIHLAMRKVARRTHAAAALEASARSEGGAAPSVLAVQPALSGRDSQVGFALVTTGFTLGGFVLGAVLAQLVPLMGNLGVGEHAVLCASLFGPSQVAMRFITMAFASGWRPLSLTLLSIGMLVLAMLLPLFTGSSVIGAAAFASLFGFASGLTSIVRGTLPLMLFGSTGYATRMGKMASFRLVVNSGAPFVLAELVQRAGVHVSLAAMAFIAILGFSAFLMIGRLVARAQAAAAERL